MKLLVLMLLVPIQTYASVSSCLLRVNTNTDIKGTDPRIVSNFETEEFYSLTIDECIQKSRKKRAEFPKSMDSNTTVYLGSIYVKYHSNEWKLEGSID